MLPLVLFSVSKGAYTMRTYIFAALVLTVCQARPRTKHLLVETEDRDEDNKEPYEGYDDAMEMELDALLGSQEYEYETPDNRGHFGDASCNFIRSFAKKNPRVKNSHPHCFGKK